MNLQRFLAVRRDERGASMLEYVLLVSLLAVVVIASMGFVGQRTYLTFMWVRDSMAAGSGIE
jgi:Flp pilus assembly pilin Flp